MMQIDRTKSRGPELTAHVGGTRITQDMREALEAIARAERTHMADVVRAMLEAGIAEWREEADE